MFELTMRTRVKNLWMVPATIQLAELRWSWPGRSAGVQVESGSAGSEE